MISEEILIEFFKKNKKKYELKHLKKIFNISFNEEKEFKETLKYLEENGQIIIDEEKNTIMSFPENDKFIFGKIHITKNGNGFLEYNGKKYEIPNEYLDASLSGDIVLCEAYNRVLDGRYLATVAKVIKRKSNNVVATYDGNDFLVYGNRLNYPISIPVGDEKKLIPGDRVLLAIKNNIKSGSIEGEIKEFIGHKDDPDLDIATIAISHNIPIDFSDETKEELKKIPDHVEKDDLTNRTNYTNDNVVTIDCDSTKDMDDAVFVKKLPNGNYELDVHIAHVANYIKKDSALYKEAFQRGNSTYMIDSVNPMLPHKLSNGICSLNPNELRLCRSTIMEITPDGEIVDFKLEKSYIISRKKMKYSDVNNILENNIVPSGYEEYVDDLKLMSELAKILKKKFEKQGLIDFESEEIKVNVDGFGKAISFDKQIQGSSEEMIEMFMIMANVCNAKYCTWNQIPAIYRVHGKPNEQKIYNTIKYIADLGFKIQKVQNVENPKVVQGVLKQLRNYKEYPILSNILLRGMQKASYSSINYGHYALGLDCYSHSTSPIRRLADLELQMAIDEWDLYLENPDLFDFDSLEQELKMAAEHSSKTERNSDDAEEEANMMRMAEYMENHIGEEFNAVITEIGNYGVFIKCANETKGKVNFKDIDGDYFEYDKDKFIVIGRKSKKQYHIGDTVIVKVKEASKEFRTVNFELKERIKKSNLRRQLIKKKAQQ